MADLKISQLPEAANLFDSVLTIVQSGVNKKASYELFKSAPIVDLSVVGSSITTPLDGSIYKVVLNADVSTAWNVPIPVVGDGANNAYFCSIIFAPPTSGGPFSVSIPESWYFFSDLNEIILGPGDEEMYVTISSLGTGKIAIAIAEFLAS